MNTKRTDGPGVYVPPPLPTVAAGPAAAVKRPCTAFTVWPPSGFLAYVPPQGVDFLADGLLRRGELCLLAGQGGLGKSRLSLWLACCQITGGDWCGLATVGEPAKWLFVGNENSVLRWQTDLAAMRKNFTPAQWEAIEAHLRLVALVEPTDGIMVLSESADRLAATLDAEKPDVLVLDPWAAFIPGDENDSRDTRDALSSLLRIVREHTVNAAVLVVAHARTGREQARRAADSFDGGNFVRGSKVLFSTARAQLNLAPGDEDDANRLILAAGKSNNGPRFATRGVIFNPATFAYGVDPDFDLATWRDAVEGKRSGSRATVTDVWRAVQDGHNKTCDIAAHLLATLKVPRRTVERLINTAVTDGYLLGTEPRGSYLSGPNRPPGT